MKILHINTHDIGGASKACFRIASALKKSGVQSDMLILRKKSDQEGMIKYIPTKIERIRNLIIKKIHKFKLKKIQLEKEETFSFPDSGFRINSKPLYKQADIINLHWISSFLDYKSFFKNNNKKIVWTLHDMEPFSGGNHYSRTKEKSKIEKQILEDKLKIFTKKKINLTIVSPSKWLMIKSSESQLFKNFQHFCIPNGIDSDLYIKYDLIKVRNELSLPLDKKIILFVAESIQDKRKGLLYLIQALEKIKYKEENIILCTVGAIIDPELLPKFNNIHNFGYIKDENMMSKIYSCADIFVIPSLEDNLPNTMIESLMCGTPVVGFKIGGIAETINDQNGILCQNIDSGELALSINRAINTDFDKGAIRQSTILKYDSRIIAKRYTELYEKIMKE